MTAMTDFERQVLSDLAELRAQMFSLLGNGHPGRIEQLEERVERHEAFLQRVGGVGAAGIGLLTLLHMAIDYLRGR